MWPHVGVFSGPLLHVVQVMIIYDISRFFVLVGWVTASDEYTYVEQ
jgi:hypothetical protein